MSNSVVKVTDAALNDSLMLLVGEDGVVTPNRDIVDAFLDNRNGSTNLQVMHVKKSADQNINLSIDNMVYLPDTNENRVRNEELPSLVKPTLEEIAKNLQNIRLDHDYTSHSEPEEDELAKTLSILDGGAADDSNFVVNRPIEVRKTPSQVKVLEDITIKPKPVSHVVSPPRPISKQSSPPKQSVKKKPEIEAIDEQVKIKKIVKVETKSKPTPIIKTNKEEIPLKPAKEEEEVKPIEKLSPEARKISKKDKRPSKNVLDDFALFSTPDIIRRVGGKDNIPEVGPIEIKPGKIERSKSVNETIQTPPKSKVVNKPDLKSKEIKQHRRNTVDSPPKKVEPSAGFVSQPIIEKNPTNDDLIMLNDNKRLSDDIPDSDANLLDGTGLDLDPSLLDNINNDLISEDILSQIAQSLVSNKELQSAIDKSLSEDNIVLPPLNDDKMDIEPDSSLLAPQKGTQIVRPDGRVVVIPPIERPTTRSRNRNNRKPLDEEHVSGNEFDSSGEEEESEDDPNKLWCICNQPHNNRFMICCDTCEEWYHGKCVNITKAMGQQMEAEGREWICLFCKDPQLRRPQAAARRIRKASRNSRLSTESGGSSKADSTLGAVPCVVCQKPSRSNSIFCSESCILTHAQGVERVLVFERSTGNMLTGNKAPSAASLEQWLKQHPGYEVVRSAGKIVTTKPPVIGPTRIPKLPRPQEKEHLSNTPRRETKVLPISKIPAKSHLPGLKVINKHQVPSPKIKTSQKETPSPLVTRVKITQSPVAKPSTSPGVKTSTSSINNTTPSKEKTTPSKTTPKVQKIEHLTPTPPQPKQENIRENVQKTLFEQLTNRLKLTEDLKLSEDELKSISTEIESQLYKCFGDTGQKYRNKYRSLIFNIKDIKNQTLWRRICEKSINPYQLVRLSPDDLASQELALWREREAKHQLDMIKKSELELLKCTRQYVMKTHKGEQILEDNRPKEHIENNEVITTLTESTNGDKSDHKKDVSRDHDKKSSKRSHKDKDRKTSRDRIHSKDHSSHKSLNKEHEHSRKRSRSRDRSSKHSSRRRSKSRDRDKHRRSSHKSSRHKKEEHRGSSTDKLDKKSKEILEQLVDNKIVPPLEDKLWKHVPPQEEVLPAPVVESDSDHEPTSTVTIPTPPRNNELDESMGHSSTESVNKPRTDTEDSNESTTSKLKSEIIWQGVINMIDVAQISITAHEVSGDCSGLGTELPTHLDIVGRISPETVWDYIGKMKSSNSKIISVVRLNAISYEEKMPYLALYSYLSIRNRLGVVKSTNKAVKDFYILPLASQKPIPQVLLPLNGPGFEESRPALLLGILVRDKRKRPLYDTVIPVSVKKLKTEVRTSTPPPRSYTPPPIKDPRLKLSIPLPEMDTQDDDEPYSPEDSDPDMVTPSTTVTPSSFLETTELPIAQPFEPFTSKFDDIPGLDKAGGLNTREIQRQMEQLNKEIEMQKSEINSISQNIATASTEIGSSALANIALPSNLQQILDSIKTIGSATQSDLIDSIKPLNPKPQESSDFTIPLILPTLFSRHQTVHNTNVDNTIPLNLPKKKNLPDTEKPSVLGSLSEEDLIRKAEEMLGDKNDNSAASSKDRGGSASEVLGLT